MLIRAVAFTGTARIRNHWPVCMRWTIDCRVRSKIPGMSAMVPAAIVIPVTRSSSISTTVSYTNCFMCPQRKKSRHVRSGDLVYETAVETEEDLVARITVAACTIMELCQESLNGHDNQWSDDVLCVNATAVINMLNYLLCKSSLASEIAVRDYIYHNKIYLFS